MALKTDLVSYWKLDEASGTRYDSHGSNDLTGSPTIGSVTGKINSAADFESANSESLSTTYTAALQPTSGPFTIACWIKIESAQVFAMIFSQSGGGYELRLDSSGTQAQFSNDTSGSVQSTVTLSTGTWYFLVGWYDGAGVMNIQVNNGTPDTLSGTPFHNRTDNPHFGSRPSGTLFFDGLIDEAAIWTRVLTSDERTEIYNNGNGLSYDSWDVAAGQPTVKRWGGVEYSPFAVGMSGIKRW